MKKFQEISSNFIIRAFIALLVLFPALLLVFGLALPPQYEETFLGEMKYKLKRLQTTEGKRIILAGGSNIPFGIKSELLAESFPGFHIVNFGMYADMGTVVMLDWAKAEIHEGDIFILMPEQNSQTLSCYFSGGDVWQAADGALELAALLPSRRYPRLAAAFPAFAGRKLYYAVNGGPKPEGVYARSAFNEYGDICYPEREYNIMSGGYNPNDLIGFDQNVISEEFIDEMNAFAAEAAEKGASVYYHFPPMNKLALAADTTRTGIDAYYDFLQKRLTFPILGNPHHSIMESGWFYDTNFHLNDSGAVVFTKYLVEDIKLILQDTSPTAVSLPPMPVSPLRLTEGDNSDADCFTYRREPEGWIIDGLTEKGLASQTLTIPVSYCNNSKSSDRNDDVKSNLNGLSSSDGIRDRDNICEMILDDRNNSVDNGISSISNDNRTGYDNNTAYDNRTGYDNNSGYDNRTGYDKDSAYDNRTGYDKDSAYDNISRKEYEDALPVIGISGTLFAGNTTLRELTIQPNIGVLYDGMFQGCTSLRKLILTGLPSDYTVGSGLLDGADFLICVPEEAAENYRRDYSWQEYDAYFIFYE